MDRGPVTLLVGVTSGRYRKADACCPVLKLLIIDACWFSGKPPVTKEERNSKQGLGSCVHLHGIDCYDAHGHGHGQCKLLVSAEELSADLWVQRRRSSLPWGYRGGRAGEKGERG